MTKYVEPVPFILTDEEAQDSIAFEVQREIDLYKWKIRNKRVPDDEVEFRISQLDLSDKFPPERIVQIIEFANQRRITAIEVAEAEKKKEEERIAARAALAAEWNADKMWQTMRQVSLSDFNKRFVLDDNNKPLVAALCYFMSNDKRFEDQLGYDLKKGLWIRGTTGIGKTHSVKCIAPNALNPVLMLSVLDITEEVRKSGDFVLNEGDAKKIYIDDVGTEEAAVKYYGTEITWFKDFIEMYYNKNLAHSKLIISTNLSFEQVKQMYGFRVESRCREMFNVINVTGEDKRRQL